MTEHEAIQTIRRWSTRPATTTRMIDDADLAASVIESARRAVERNGTDDDRREVEQAIQAWTRSVFERANAIAGDAAERR